MEGPHPVRTDTDMENLFKDLENEIETRAKHIERLKYTLDTFQQKPDLFDEKDYSVLSAVLKKRVDEYSKITQDFGAARDLYRATVMELENKIREKEELLKQTDAAYGSISAEDELRLHFAQKQAQLQQGLLKAKAQLCATIYDRLRPNNS